MRIRDTKRAPNDVQSRRAVPLGSDGGRIEPACACHVCQTLRKLITTVAFEAVTVDEAQRMVGG